jgi:hypothetical protein
LAASAGIRRCVAKPSQVSAIAMSCARSSGETAFRANVWHSRACFSYSSAFCIPAYSCFPRTESSFTRTRIIRNQPSTSLFVAPDASAPHLASPFGVAEIRPSRIASRSGASLSPGLRRRRLLRSGLSHLEPLNCPPRQRAVRSLHPLLGAARLHLPNGTMFRSLRVYVRCCRSMVPHMQ